MRDLIRRNLGYKVVSLVLAIVFSLWITSQVDPVLFNKNNISVPLIPKNQPANLVIVSNLPSITVRIDNAQGVDVTDLYAYVDLKDATPGEHSFKVAMNMPEGVKVESLSPNTVVIKLDLVKDKIVPVVVKTTGQVAEGFVVGEPQVVPEVVNVRGPESIIDRLENVVVDVNVTGMKESKRVAWPVTFKDLKSEGLFGPDPNLKSLNPFPDTVEVLIPVYPEGLAEKAVPLRVATRGDLASGLELRNVAPVPARVQLLGDSKSLKEIQYIDLGVIDISEITSNKIIDINLKSITLPQGVSFIEGTKISVSIEVVSSPINKKIKGIPVEVKNIAPGLQARTIPEIEITVRGYPNVLEKINPKEISAWVDAEGLETGSYPNTLIYWSVPPGISVVQAPQVELVLEVSAVQ